MALKTEADARKCWCPFARTLEHDLADVRSGDDPVPVGASINRRPGKYDAGGNETVELTGSHRCIGSDCMAWRIGRPAQHRDDCAHIRTRNLTRATEPCDCGMDPALGYCGLAGEAA